MDELTMYAELYPAGSTLDAGELDSLRAELFPNEPALRSDFRLLGSSQESPTLGRVAPEQSRSRFGRHFLLRSAAGVVLLAGVLGVVLVNRESPAPAVPLADSVAGVDPAGALFVLPDPVDLYQLANGHFSTSFPDALGDDTEAFAPNGLVLGVEEGNGYTDLRTVSVYAQPPTQNGQWTEVDTPSGPAFVSSGAPLVSVAQQRATNWLVITTPTDGQLALEALDLVNVDESGQIFIDDQPGDLVVIDELQRPTASVEYSTTYETETADGALVSVETGTYPTPLFPSASVADRIEPTQIDGARAWIATRVDADGEWIGLVWNATPNRIIAISGHNTDLAEITRLAESLDTVDEAAWRLALPDATFD